MPSPCGRGLRRQIQIEGSKMTKQLTDKYAKCCDFLLWRLIDSNMLFLPFSTNEINILSNVHSLLHLEMETVPGRRS